MEINAKRLTVPVVLFAVGCAAGVTVAFLTNRDQCKMDFSVKEYKFGLDCATQPADIWINLGEAPRAWKLSSALSSVVNASSAYPSAHIIVDSSIMDGKLGALEVQAPTGRQRALQVVAQLLQNARVRERVDICFEGMPGSAGYRVRLR